MTKAELVRSVTTALRNNNKKKPVSSIKHVLHISDDFGNKKDFVVHKSERNIIYTVEDVEAILEYTIAVIEDALKRGEEITIRGFGTLGLKYRQPRSTRSLKTGERVAVEGRYVPKFSFGNELRHCAKYFELSQKAALEDLQHIDDEYEEEGDE